jgi:protein Mpv17
VLKGAVEGRPLEVTYAKYKEDLWENCKALWMIWVPAQLVNFSVVPHHLRIPFGEQPLGAARAGGLRRGWASPPPPCAAAAAFLAQSLLCAATRRSG